MTPEQLARAEERSRHPCPGSKIEAAQRCGVDLELMIELLRLTPEERVKRAERILAAKPEGAEVHADDDVRLAELEALLEAQEPD